MARYKLKSPELIAIGFAEIVEYGLSNTKNIVDGMPWSFDYMGLPVTHENNECYLITTKEAVYQITPDTMLLAYGNGRVDTLKVEVFNMLYEFVSPSA